jgi:endonuclease YncB( thermonuclease family)
MDFKCPKVMEFTVIQVTVIDGDTVHCKQDYGRELTSGVSVRWAGFDAPETNRGLVEHRVLGVKVKEAVIKWFDRAVKAGLPMKCISYARDMDDKYGRLLGDFKVDRIDYDETLIGYLRRNKLVRMYGGGPRPAWTDEELQPIRDFVLPVA